MSPRLPSPGSFWMAPGMGGQAGCFTPIMGKNSPLLSRCVEASERMVLCTYPFAPVPYRFCLWHLASDHIRVSRPIP